MADTIAKWGGIQVQIVSEEVVAAIEAVNSFLELVNQALDVALQVAEIVKTFVTSNLDITRALVNELISLLQSFIQDLFGLGIYYNLGDVQIVRKGKAGLKGGYPAYERRMLTRLNDRTDPNRPDYTASSTVLAMFFYVGVDVGFVNDVLDTSRFAPLIQLLNGFGSLLGLHIGADSGLPLAVNLRAEYSSPSNTGVPDFSIALSSLLGKSKVKVIWNSAPAPGGSPQDPVPQVPSSGFIVEVSCYPKGFQAAWITPATSATGDSSNQPYTTGPYQAGNSGQPLVIFGGVDAIRLDSDVLWPTGWHSGTPLSSGAHPAYFFRDSRTPEVIRNPFGMLSRGSDRIYYNQRRFFVGKESNLLQMVSGGNYSLTLDPALLPLYCPIENGEIITSRATVPTTVYVRVIPVSDRITLANCTSARWRPLPHGTDEETLVHIDQTITIEGGGTLSDADLGTPSDVLEVQIPSAQQDLYGKALQTAITILTLSRSDLVEPDPVAEGHAVEADSTYRETGLESIATEVDRYMGIPNPENYYSTRGISPQAFLQELSRKIVSQATSYIRTQGVLAPEILASLAPTIQALTEWKWSDTSIPGAQGNPSLRYTILQSIDPASYLVTPLARNRYSTRMYYSGTTPDNVLLQLEDRWNAGSFGVLRHQTSVDSSPVIGPSNNAQPGFWYVRDLIPTAIYNQARTILSLTSDLSVRRPSPQGTWGSKRLFAPRAPMGVALTALNTVNGFLGTSLSGLSTVADGILRVIDFLEQRVREVQELIRRIKTLLDIPFEIVFPSAKVLLLITNGTSGVVTGLVSAEEKPQEGVTGYAGGIMLVAGSAPSILIELISGWVKPNA